MLNDDGSARGTGGEPRFDEGMHAQDESWMRTLTDLSAQLEHRERQELLAVAQDLVRTERARISLADRLRGAIGQEIRLELDALRVAGAVAEVGADWVELRQGPVSRAIVLLPSVRALEGLQPRVRDASGPCSRPRSLASVLREAARDRAVVSVSGGAGSRSGRIIGVGADHVELAEAPAGERSSSARAGAVVLPFSGIDAVTIS